MTAKQIREKRASLVWTQKKFAEIMCVTIRTVQNWEKNGCKRPIISNYIGSLHK